MTVLFLSEEQMLLSKVKVLAFISTCLLLGCGKPTSVKPPPVKPADISAYEAEYFLWRGSVEQQLGDLRTLVWGDRRLLQQLAVKTDRRHFRFLHKQVRQDQYCSVVLRETQFGSEELRDALGNSRSPSRDQVLWIEWFAKQFPDGFRGSVSRFPAENSIKSKIKEGQRRYQIYQDQFKSLQ